MTFCVVQEGVTAIKALREPAGWEPGETCLSLQQHQPMGLTQLVGLHCSLERS